VFEKQTWVQIVVRVLYKFAFRGVQTAFFQNKEDLAYCVENRLVSAQCCKLLPGSGVNLDRFCESLPPRSPAQRVFMMYGRLLPQKGYYIFMEAARILRSKLGDSAQCWILGIEDQNRAQSRELLVAIKEAARLGIVRHLPAVVDVRPVLAEVDVVVLPSYYNEGVPRSILEAMACGKPVIASDWKGCRETVRDSKNGFLVPVRDVHALVQAMLKMNSMSDEELRAMGRASRRIAEQYYDEREVLWLYLREILGEQADADDVLRRRFVLPGAALARDGSSERLVA
jgi:glycosyltransferase involved in cell wall biosynthesis